MAVVHSTELLPTRVSVLNFTCHTRRHRIPASHRASVSSQNWSEHPVLDLLTWIPLFLVASFPGRYSSTALRMKSMTTPSYLRWAAVSRWPALKIRRVPTIRDRV